MFARAYRLPGHRLPVLLKSKLNFYSPLFTLKVNPATDKQLRVGVITPVSVSRLAVVRNRCRRLIREALKPYLAKIKPGQELLFIAKPPLVGKTLKEIESQIRQLLHEKLAS